MSPPLDLQSLVAVAAVSALFTLASGIVYRRDPARRRWLIAGLALVLVAAPWWTAAGLWTLPVGLSGDGPSPLGAPVPFLAAIQKKNGQKKNEPGLRPAIENGQAASRSPSEEKPTAAIN